MLAAGRLSKNRPRTNARYLSPLPQPHLESRIQDGLQRDPKRSPGASSKTGVWTPALAELPRSLREPI
eukprot:5292343-Pyramimonas_sp.AAC.1